MEFDFIYFIKVWKIVVFVMVEDGMDKGLWISYFLDFFCGYDLGYFVLFDMVFELWDKISLMCSFGVKLLWVECWECDGVEV